MCAGKTAGCSYILPYSSLRWGLTSLTRWLNIRPRYVVLNCISCFTRTCIASTWSGPGKLKLMSYNKPLIISERHLLALFSVSSRLGRTSSVSGQRPTGQRASTPMPSNVDCSKPRLVLYEQEGFFAGRRGCQDNKGCEIVPRKSEQQQQKVSMTPDQTPGRDTYSACGIR